jgi:protein gp37
VTKIEWTRGDDGTSGVTWNPTSGCDKVSPGCDNCYALTMAHRLKAMGQAKYQRDGDPRTSGPGFGVSVHPDELSAPLRWRKPRRVFVDSMGDLFHDQVSDEFLARVWAVMAATPQHTYQILTKRHGRMRSLLSDHNFGRSVYDASDYMLLSYKMGKHVSGTGMFGTNQALPNVWLGVSVEDKQRAAFRISALRETPAAVRFLSCEPLLGPLDELDLTGIGWVIVGGESGSGARPMNLDWVRSIRDQCQAAGVAVFVKQLGSVWAGGVCRADRKGGDPSVWPADLRIREFPTVDAVPPSL